MKKIVINLLSLKVPIITLLFLFLLSPIVFSYDIMPVDSVKAGMKGYGISVFGGNKVDTFSVEILGVLKKAGPDRQLIIARLSGAGLEKTGIIAGMSGSPVFISNKIIGAVAYAWAFSIEPITGITPIEEMLATKGDSFAQESGDAEFEIEGEGKTVPYSGIKLKKIRTPLSVSGFDDRLVKYIDDFFEGKGFSIVIGGSSAGEGREKDFLFPGSAVAARLVGGDASIGAIGTVSYIEGKDVYMFGHPLYYSGKTSIPMTTAYVYAILPSQESSFKIASTEKEIGAVIQDRGNAVYGELGRKAETVPFNVDIIKGKKRRSFHFDVVRHKELTPFFLGILFSNAILTQGRAYGNLTISMDMNLKLENYPEVKLRNFFSGGNAYIQAMNDISDILKLIFNDRFEKIKVRGIDITASISEEERSYEIVNAKPEAFIVKRGVSVDIEVLLRGLKGKTRYEKFTLKIPETYTDSVANVALVSAGAMIGLEMERVPDRFKTERKGQLFELLKLAPRNNVLYCLLLSRKVGVVMKGFELSSLPSSMLRLLEGSQALGEGRFTKGSIVRRKEKECDFVVSGSKVVTLKITD